MKKYIDPENQRYQYQVVATLNGYSVEVLVVPSGDLAALTPQVASQLNVQLPDGYRLQSCKRENAEKELERLARLNGWTEVDNPSG
jgi:hypothetical protein